MPKQKDAQFDFKWYYGIIWSLTWIGPEYQIRPDKSVEQINLATMIGAS